METYESLIKEAQAKHAEAQALLQKAGDKLTPEVEEKINSLLGEFDVLRARAEMLRKVGENQAFLESPAGTQAAHLGWRQAGPGEGEARIDPRAWRKVEVKIWPTGETKEFRFHVPLAVQKPGYPSAFEAYLRKGFDDLGPNDRKTLTEGVDIAGGFLVPEDFQAELIKKVAAMATIRANARVRTTSRDVAPWPRVNYTTDDRYTSGVRLTWTGESPASSTVHRVTDPVYGLINIPVHTSMASMPISNDMIEDAAFDVIGHSQELLAEAFALGENDAFINGSGVAQPMGIVAQVDGDGPASVVSGSATTLTPDGLIDLGYALPSQYDRNAKWYMRKATEKVIRKLKDTTNNYIWPVWQQAGGFAPAPRELLGAPVLLDEFVPAIAANDFPIIFGDLSGYIVLDRVGLAVQRLSELYAETNITLLLARKRVGGYLAEPFRVKVQKIST